MSIYDKGCVCGGASKLSAYYTGITIVCELSRAQRLLLRQINSSYLFISYRRLFGRGHGRLVPWKPAEYLSATTLQT